MGQVMPSINTNYADLIIPEKINDEVTVAGLSSFAGRVYNNISLPDTITDIPANCFEDTIFRSIVLPKYLTSIGQYAFYESLGLTALILPNTLQTIGDYAFQFIDTLTSINFEENS
jgi:hypothetical protein